MRRSAGFTLIELVIVIVILGILGAVAAPKLFNLQGDAYGANLNAMKSSIQTSMTMANAKAQISGKGLTDNETTDVPEYDGIGFLAGYPVADGTSTKAAPKGILATLDSFDYERYNITATTTSPVGITISPNAAANSATCKVTYTQAKATDATDADDIKPAEPAKVEVETSGC